MCMQTQNDSLEVSSSHSFRTSLEGVKNGTDGLDERRESMLKRVPQSNNWANFAKGSLTTNDIAYLSAKTGHEFAILRGKRVDILFHGVAQHCKFTDDLVDMLKSGQLRLFAHSHPDYDVIIPSADDRKFLNTIKQKESIIISWITGKEITFTGSAFDI